MFRNYLVTALRNIGRHRLYSVINIAGLALALTCAIFIMLFMADELSFDRWIPGTGNVYRVDFGVKIPGHQLERADNSMFPLGAAMKAQIPQVVGYTHIFPPKVTLWAGGRLFSQHVAVVDPDFFQIIRLPLLAGSPARVFAQPNSIVLSQSMATKLFGTAPAMGRTVLVNGDHPLTVTGILRDLPHNTQLKASVLFPNTSRADPFPEVARTNWEGLGPVLYVKLAPDSDHAQVLAMIRRIIDHSINAKSFFGVDIPASEVFRPHLTPFVDGHLEDFGGARMTPGGSWSEIYGFGAIAALILLIACFNFTNLSTARATMRAREVSLRKVVGARRIQLILQFLGESMVTAMIALVLALALVSVLTPAYDSFVGRPITLNLLQDWPMSLTIVVAALLTGLLGGIYPAFVLSGFRPANALHAGGASAGSGLLRTGLVALQFAISIGLAIVALVVFAQIRYSERENLGFNRSHIVVIHNFSDMPEARRADFQRALEAEPSVAGTAQSDSTPFEGRQSLEIVQLPGSPEHLTVERWEAGPNFAKVYRLKLLAGRFLSQNHAQDLFTKTAHSPVNVVVTEAAARLFGYSPEDAIGRTLQEGQYTLRIVGMVENLRLAGPQVKVEPIILEYDQDLPELSVRIRPGQTRQALAAINRAWHSFAPNKVMDLHFLDATFDSLFRADQQRERVFSVFVGVAILVACLGLYGLAAFATQRRTQEIGIRKVFGAGVWDIVRLLLWQFSVPVLLANIVAWPIAWYYLTVWLQSFANRIWLSPMYFIAAGLVALAIAWLTVATHAIAAARTRPTRALRCE